MFFKYLSILEVSPLLFFKMKSVQSWYFRWLFYKGNHLLLLLLVLDGCLFIFSFLLNSLSFYYRRIVINCHYMGGFYDELLLLNKNIDGFDTFTCVGRQHRKRRKIQYLCIICVYSVVGVSIIFKYNSFHFFYIDDYGTIEGTKIV